MNIFSKLKKSQQGATMVEYAIMVALIAVVSIAIITLLGQKVANTFDIVQQQIPQNSTPQAPTGG